MPIIHIDDADDPRLAAFMDLPHQEPREDFVVEGRWLVERLLRSSFRVGALLAGLTHAEKADELVRETYRLDPQSVPPPIYSIDTALLHQVVGFKFHRGMLACASRRTTASLDALVEPTGERQIVVICPRISDEMNLGGILRTGAAFGVSGFLLGPHSADPYSRRALRVSMGSALRTPIRRSQDFFGDLEWLQLDANLQLVASVLDTQSRSAVVLSEMIGQRSVGLLLGPEDFGLDPSILARCNHHVTIPMEGSTDSLNVVVAAGILLHELRRVRA